MKNKIVTGILAVVALGVVGLAFSEYQRIQDTRAEQDQETDAIIDQLNSEFEEWQDSIEGGEE